jgi:hypothetical protein
MEVWAPSCSRCNPPPCRIQVAGNDGSARRESAGPMNRGAGGTSLSIRHDHWMTTRSYRSSGPRCSPGSAGPCASHGGFEPRADRCARRGLQAALRGRSGPRECRQGRVLRPTARPSHPPSPATVVRHWFASPSVEGGPPSLLPRTGGSCQLDRHRPGSSLSLRSSWYRRCQALRTSSSPAVPLEGV